LSPAFRPVEYPGDRADDRLPHDALPPLFENGFL
jgi:hypothetical protein